MIPSEPLVSVVIPTINRPQLVFGAVDSALRQTLREIEVIVVVDGPDDATRRVLQAIDDPRLRVLPLPENVGLGEARRAGTDAARGWWVALLDDDDAWLPRKLEIQLDTARRSRYRLPIITCRVIAVSNVLAHAITWLMPLRLRTSIAAMVGGRFEGQTPRRPSGVPH